MGHLLVLNFSFNHSSIFIGYLVLISILSTLHTTVIERRITKTGSSYLFRISNDHLNTLLKACHEFNSRIDLTTATPSKRVTFEGPFR